jgi:hypothetical protein
MIHRSDNERIWSLRQIGTSVPSHEIAELFS